LLFFGWFEFLFTLPTRRGSASNAYDQWTKDGVVEALLGMIFTLLLSSNQLGFQSAKKVFTEEFLKLLPFLGIGGKKLLRRNVEIPLEPILPKKDSL